MDVYSVKDLSVSFPSGKSACSGVNFSVARGQILGVVGETGAGKSVSTLAPFGGVAGARVEATSIQLGGLDLTQPTEATLRSVRGRLVTFVPQDARTALHPMVSVGKSLTRILRSVEGLRRGRARERVLRGFSDVGLRDPERVFDRLPSELSGGMGQRVMIAASLMTEPQMIVADEPTTALDLTVQVQVLELFRKRVKETQVAALLVTHDLGVVAQYCDKVMVMRDGQVVEAGRTADVLVNPTAAYTEQLIAAGTYAATGAFRRDPGSGKETRLLVSDVSKSFKSGRKRFRAVSDVDLHVDAGETLAIVGESGAGKTTLASIMLRLTAADEGRTELFGEDVSQLSERQFRKRRSRITAVFQDPSSALDPRMTGYQLVEEPLRIFEPELRPDQARARIREQLVKVGLNPDVANGTPTRLSGGEKQRLAIARALVTNPMLVVLDEPTASLDMSVRGRVLDLLVKLQEEAGHSYVLISHDLGSVRRLAHRTAVMYQGRVVECGDTAQVLTEPRHPYTVALLSASLSPDPRQPHTLAPERALAVGARADAPGCPYAPRCRLHIPQCDEGLPELEGASGHLVRCIRVDVPEPPADMVSVRRGDA